MRQLVSFRAPRGVLAALLFVTLLSVGLAGCGGSDDDPPGGPIGAAGGVASGPDGALASVPAGALTQATAIAVAQSDLGAPPLPSTAAAVGKVFALTPHGTTFARAVTVKLPFDPALVAAGDVPSLLKTTANQTVWEAVPGARVTGGFVEADIDTFSWIVVVVPPTLPTVAASPADRSVVEGSSATFTVAATGPAPSGALRYQWQRNGVDIPGATTSSLTTPALVLADSGAQYRAVVSNNAGSVTSAAATLTVSAVLLAPSITQAPADLSVAEGAGASFSVVAAGANLAYQWQRSSDAGLTFTDVGINAPTFVLAATARADDNARLRVIVSNGAGSVTSTAATLTVTAAPPPPAATRPVRLAAGGIFSLAILADGSLRAWGDNTVGNLGDGTTAPRAGPVVVNTIHDALTVAASSHALVVRAGDGSVWGWGYNGFGQVGNRNGPCGGACASVTSPTRAGTLTNVVSVATGTLHSLAARADGTVWAWGNNDSGQLGDGGVVERTQPIQVPGLAGVTMVAAHGNFSLALKGDGTVWAWGDNTNGQLGDGTTSARRSPVQVHGLGHVFWISAGATHAIALDDGGAVQRPGQLHLGTGYVWGDNAAGQLGTGSTISETTPRAVGGVLRDASAGGAHSLFLHFDDVPFAAGRNAEGQVGDGTTIARTSPAFVGGVLCEAVSAGGAHSLCADANGQVWAWGLNASGQVGDGTLVNRVSPVRVNGVNIH